MKIFLVQTENYYDQQFVIVAENPAHAERSARRDRPDIFDNESGIEVIDLHEATVTLKEIGDLPSWDFPGDQDPGE